MSKRKQLTARSMAEVAEAVDTEAIEEIRELARREVFASPQPSAEVMAEIFARIGSLPRSAASRLLLALAADGGDRAVPLLERHVQSSAPGVASAAIAALGAVRTASAAELLVRVVETDPNRELRKEAKRALFRLRSLGVVVEAPVAAAEEGKVKYPIFRSAMSTFDGVGNRAMVLGVERPLGGVDRIALLLNLRLGLTNCDGIDTSRRTFSENVNELLTRPEHGVLWAEAPPSYCQQLVQEALALNPKRGTPVPRGYYYWREEIGQPTEHYDRPLIYREVSTLEVKWDPTLLEHSGQLLDLHEFDSWAFDIDQVRPYFVEVEQTKRSAVTLTGWSQKERQEAVLKRFFEEIVTPEEHARYKRELEEMAYVFLRHDRRLDARRTLAAAVAMDEFRGGNLTRIPFMREMLLKSMAWVERELRGEPEISARDLGIITPDQFMRY